MTNLAFELDPLELEEEEAELGEQSGSAKTSVSSVTTPPPHGKRIPFFKKVIPVVGVWAQLWWGARLERSPWVPSLSCRQPEAREGGDRAASCLWKGAPMQVMPKQPDVCPGSQWKGRCRVPPLGEKLGGRVPLTLPGSVGGHMSGLGPDSQGSL